MGKVAPMKKERNACSVPAKKKPDGKRPPARSGQK
jgi:hypothetical protein